MKARIAVHLILLILLVCLSLPAFAQQVPAEGQYQPLISGMQHYRDGNYEKALEEFIKAAIIFPDDPDIPFYIGLTYLQLNQPEQAIESFKKTLKMAPGYTDVQFQLGLALIQQEKYQEAITHLEDLHKKEPEREDLGYFLGFAYYELGQYEKTLRYLEVAKTKDKTIEGLTMYYTGLARQQLGLAKEAKAAYREVINLDPTSPLVTPSRRLIDIIVLEERLKRRFNFELTTRLQYDDNLILVPTTNVFNLRDRKRKSLTELFFLRGEYVFARAANWETSTSYAVYQTITNSLRDFDVQDHIGALDWVYRGSIKKLPYSARLNYTYDFLLLDYEQFLQRHTVRPTVILQEGPSNVSVVQYTFQAKIFTGEPVVPQDDRDAVNHEGGLVHFLLFGGGRHHLKAGFFYDRELAEGDDWDYRGYKFLVGAQYTLPWEVRLNVDYGLKRFNYLKNNSFFLRKREDTEHTIDFVLSKAITESLTLFVEYLRRDNESNIALFDFEKNLVSIGVTWWY